MAELKAILDNERHALDEKIKSIISNMESNINFTNQIQQANVSFVKY